MLKSGINFYTITSLSIACAAISIIIWYNIKSIETNLKNETITMGFAGDIMLGRTLNEIIDLKSYVYPLGDLIPVLKQNDFNLVNLETTLTNSKKKIPKVFNFKATPDKVKTLILGNINIVNLANNHILDFSTEGLSETIKTLDEAKILHVGAGINITEAKKPAIVKKANITIAIFGYTNNEPQWQAQENKPGTNYIKIGDIETIKNDIAAYKNEVDFIIVSMHWGPNMRQKPTGQFINFAHAMIDAGIDIVHGHSAHIFQPIEIYKSKLIIYDAGDFVDDYAVDPILRNDQSFLFLVQISKNGEGRGGIKRVKLIPLLIKNYQVNLASGSDYKQILLKMTTLSKDFGTEINASGEIILGRASV